MIAKEDFANNEYGIKVEVMPADSHVTVGKKLVQVVTRKWVAVRRKQDNSRSVTVINRARMAESRDSIVSHGRYTAPLLVHVVEPSTIRVTVSDPVEGAFASLGEREQAVIADTVDIMKDNVSLVRSITGKLKTTNDILDKMEGINKG